MTNNQSILKAQSPAGLAEEYIVMSIWNNHYPPGSDLPAERELAERIGVTRTTLREVLQRLARDGWLNIQHGKPTKVNNVWETAGPNIIGTLIKLDKSTVPTIISNVVSLRTRMGEHYIPEAIKMDSVSSLKLFESLPNLQDDENSFADFDYHLYRSFTFVAQKPVYGLILNSFKDLYHKVAILFFSEKKSRKFTLSFYHNLAECCKNGDYQKAAKYLSDNKERSAEIWKSMLNQLPDNFGE
ncbi:GntR family transcriptional regulator [Bisgaardia hudsonensis]|uniref:Fatty acid metabolism regulator protein n=1 Tax=Bisgaardia hudsonensis TaxID=109472 RepID=A0A4R2N284_9PAST|nr:fatty acid metabolism transcriptional regulator FadR [Bisgaardia hudsonensis]QLB12392.1 fatty acid metabolism regulator [Bisgaardia hudsonensis]TCP13919.1 GntR family transcriptional regulator [Bisgaardia hudsonensis]